MILQRYTFGSKSQRVSLGHLLVSVAYDIAKIYIWKQITTEDVVYTNIESCLWYCKDIHLEANHNPYPVYSYPGCVAYDIAKIYIWKQITTPNKGVQLSNSCLWYCKDIHLEANHNSFKNTSMTVQLLMILQRYTFGSKSQHGNANNAYGFVAYDIAKIYIWKQITTRWLV